MTTIPDAAIEAAVRGYVEADPEDLTPEQVEQAIVLWLTDPELVAPMRAALEAALPHLTPAPQAENARAESVAFVTSRVRKALTEADKVDEDGGSVDFDALAREAAERIVDNVPVPAPQAEGDVREAVGKVIRSGLHAEHLVWLHDDDIEPIVEHLTGLVLSSGLVVPAEIHKVATDALEAGDACDAVGCRALIERDALVAALSPVIEYVNIERNYTTLLGDHHANDVQLVMRDLRLAQAEEKRLREIIQHGDREAYEDAALAAATSSESQTASNLDVQLQARLLSGEHVGLEVVLPDGKTIKVEQAQHAFGSVYVWHYGRQYTLAPDDVVTLVAETDGA